MAEGQIRQSLSGFYDIYSEGKMYRTRARGNFRKRKITPLVGDRVKFDSSSPKEGYILEILPRDNALTRPPVANIDQGVVVTAVAAPEFSTNLLDRQLIALEVSHIAPVIYFTKTDLIDDDRYQTFETLATGYRKIGYPVCLTREPFASTGLDQLRDTLAGKETVIMGQTGAGKSTLLNHLSPELTLATGEISTALNRGRHTTRKVSLMPVANGLVADTPGFSSYDTLTIDYRELGQYFPEFLNVASECRFRGCVHVNEPGCAVKDRLAAGEFMQSRYDNYLQLLTLLKNQKPIYNKKK
ncbi:ribosome small subunit-dependent GTPase A [Levilactobacillus brevis]|uniref:Small ribosomal subunit biogenesis GTPase RsgA n=1 Tax=Levilactobacillus brevis TaxID=1580 RepID=A0AAJ5FIA3_LEVBR|nr:ribosome small subunit-dependent GTPase A [Levilactobacillus brevis]AWP46471.1 ribosome small subunit-dependent GTPase A [Levilactobacillus brevis]RAY09751.1 ribosome small subunit-dependent GTPase A [Levilactobacillus brevis]TOZ04036.1 ribosome small subunit-dependent GTPase A [Levilactobacillus brevis]